MNIARTVLIAIAVLVHSPLLAAAAPSTPQGDEAPTAPSKLRAPVVMASVATDVPQAEQGDDAEVQTASDAAPKPKRRAARVTTCRCGDGNQ